MQTREAESESEAKPYRSLLDRTAPLLAFFFLAWCALSRWRTHDLQRQLEAQMRATEDVGRLRAELVQLRDHRLRDDRPVDLPPLHGIVQTLDQLAHVSEDAELGIAARQLELALAPLLRDSGADRNDRLWSASRSALAAVTAVETRLGLHLSNLLRRLDNHWRALDLVIVVSLLLAGWSLLLLRRLERRRRELELVRAEAARRSSHDSLTGLWNREAILGLLREELVRASRTQTPTGVILVDLDRFQELNLMLGEDQGDFILRQVGARLGSVVRPYDTLGRFGGDSFLVVLPSCDSLATGAVADRLVHAVNSQEMDHAVGRVLVTISLAHATVTEPREVDPSLLLHRLNERLSGPRIAGTGPPDPARILSVEVDPAAASAAGDRDSGNHWISSGSTSNTSMP